MKKAAIVLSLLLLISLVSCSEPSETSAPPETSVPAETSEVTETSEPPEIPKPSAPFTFEAVWASGCVFSTSGSASYREQDIGIAGERYQKTDMPSRSISVNGQTWNCEYLFSVTNFYFNADTDWYKSSQNDYIVMFSINPGTEDIYLFTYLPRGDVYLEANKNSPVLTESQCLDIALQYLEQYVDADEYSLIDSRYRDYTSVTGIYEFELARTVDGIKTSDTARVDVTIYGDVLGYQFNTLNEMVDPPVLSSEDYQVIESKVHEKIKSVYDSLEDAREYSYDLNHAEATKVFSRLADGRYAMVYSVPFDIVIDSANEISVAELVTIVVYIE